MNFLLTKHIKAIINYASEIQIYDEGGKHVGDAMVKSPEYEIPNTTEQYILFLVKSPIGTNMYSQSSVPYQMKIENDGSVHFVSERIAGQLAENVRVIDESTGEAEIVHEIREGDIQVEIEQTLTIIKDFLEEDNIVSLEKTLRKHGN
nr:hypothetical protein [Evansella caseinilytica]